MFQIGIIGCGPIATYVATQLNNHSETEVTFALVTARSVERAPSLFGDSVAVQTQFSDVQDRPDLFVDCAGHAGLQQHGPDILAAGIDLISISVGAMADDALAQQLADAAARGDSQLHLAAGAIGGLDALSAAMVGGVDSVTYTGRKPPQGWRGSPAEDVFDLENLTEARVHFSGSARDAALNYPKNANVAAAVALAGIGFDKTIVELIADPSATGNRHEVSATGTFGRLRFEIEGNALPDNPKSSAMAAMSVVRAVLNRVSSIKIG